MRNVVLLLLAITSAAWAQPPSAPYELGQKLTAGSLLYIPKQRCLTGPGKIESCIRVRTHSIIYTIGYRSKGNTITYIETHDPTFSTVDGLRVGSSLDGSAGTLSWLSDFGEVAGPVTSDGWQPIVARDPTFACNNGANLALSSEQSHNSAACPIQILGFKKRAYEGQLSPRSGEYSGQ